jgi:uncharacterized protein (DUF2062 family)
MYPPLYLLHFEYYGCVFLNLTSIYDLLISNHLTFKFLFCACYGLGQLTLIDKHKAIKK